MVLYKDVGGALPEAPLPADEQQRCNQLCSYNILDTVSMCCAQHGPALRALSLSSVNLQLRLEQLRVHPSFCILPFCVSLPTLLLVHTSTQGCSRSPVKASA